jgi:hypothetical protein
LLGACAASELVPSQPGDRGETRDAILPSRTNALCLSIIRSVDQPSLASISKLRGSSASATNPPPSIQQKSCVQKGWRYGRPTPPALPHTPHASFHRALICGNIQKIFRDFGTSLSSLARDNCSIQNKKARPPAEL